MNVERGIMTNKLTELSSLQIKRDSYAAVGRGRGRGRGRGGGPGSPLAQNPSIPGQQVGSPHQSTMPPSTMPKSAEAAFNRSRGPQSTPIPEGGITSLIKRPDKGGTLGSKIALHANHFQITLKNPGLVIHQYDITVGREGDRRPLKDREAHIIFWGFIRANPEVFGSPSETVFDRKKQAYSKNLFRDTDRITVLLEMRSNLPQDENDNDRRVTLAIKHVGSLKVGDYKTSYHPDLEKRKRQEIQFLELLFRQNRHFNHLMVPIGKSFYFQLQNLRKEDPQTDRALLNTHAKSIDLGCGRELLRGFYMSTRIIDNWKLSLNVNWSSTPCFQEINVVDFINKVLTVKQKLPPWNPNQRDLLPRHTQIISEELRFSNPKHAVKLYQENTKQTFTPMGFANSAQLQTFDWHERNKVTGAMTKKCTISVADYYLQRYGVPLKYPGWPVIARGSKAKQTYVPVELCRIAPGQVVRVKQISSNEQANIIKATAVTPHERRERILGMLKLAKFAADTHLRDMYLSLSFDMIQADGRVLPPPLLKYKNSTVTPKNGQWNTPQLLKGQRLNRWAFLSCSDRVQDDELFYYANLLINEARKMSMEIAPVHRNVYRYVGREQVGSLLQRMYKEIPDIEMVVVILNSSVVSDSIYGEVKHVGEQGIGVMTQCLKDDRIIQCRSNQRDQGKKGIMSLSNIILKLNAKAGGVNVAIASNPNDPITTKYLYKPILFIGADVTHPAPDDRRSPSIAAVCGNLDNHPDRYMGIELIQQSRKEIITDFKDAVKMLLKEYYTSTRAKPDSIIFYRDGVAESQFASVLSNELMAMRQACMELESTYKPAITFIIVQKRHNTRFFKTNLNASDKAAFQNIPPGTVVDLGVTHPVEFDFYLCSHQGIQGTSRPTHYHVLYDDNRFTSDDLQALTYRLCHTYARCTKSVSIPAPCYYAHHIAFRAKTRLNQVTFGSETASTASGGSDSGLSPDELLDLQSRIRLQDKMKKRMYWQ